MQKCIKLVDIIKIVFRPRKTKKKFTTNPTKNWINKNRQQMINGETFLLVSIFYKYSLFVKEKKKKAN